MTRTTANERVARKAYPALETQGSEETIRTTTEQPVKNFGNNELDPRVRAEGKTAEVYQNTQRGGGR